MANRPAAALRSRHKKKSGNLVGLALAAFVLFCSVKIISLQVDISKKDDELKQLQADIKKQEELNNELEGQLTKGKENEEENIARIAFEQYGYGYPDEHVYYDSSVN